MKHRRLIVVLVILAFGWLAPLWSQEQSLTSQVIEKILPNGLKVLMVKRPQAPLVRCILAYRVGSVNERPGITGISHFHEHMMFKGTYSMGIKPGTRVVVPAGDDHIEIRHLPEKPDEHFHGFFQGGPSLTKALLEERRKERVREEKKCS
jgi:predicted Zn-dependent peptidase